MKHPLTISQVGFDELKSAIEIPFLAQFNLEIPEVRGDQWRRFLIQMGDELVGWHFGSLSQPGSYYMTNTCVLPQFRRLGVYTTLITEIISELSRAGVTQFFSRHDPSNHPVIEAKKKIGFIEAGYFEDPRLGRLLILVKLVTSPLENQRQS